MSVVPSLPGHERAFERDGAGGGAGVEVGDQGVGRGVGEVRGGEEEASAAAHPLEISSLCIFFCIFF